MSNETGKCPNCGSPIKDDDKFCGKCGFNLFKKCYRCGKEISVSNRFCPHCGSDNSEEALQVHSDTVKAKIDKNAKKMKKFLLIVLIAVLIIVALFLSGKVSDYIRDKNSLSEQQLFIGQVVYHDYTHTIHDAFLIAQKDVDQTVNYFVIIDGGLVVSNEKYNKLLVGICQRYFTESRYSSKEKIENEFIGYIDSGTFDLVQIDEHSVRDLSYIEPKQRKDVIFSLTTPEVYQLSQASAISSFSDYIMQLNIGEIENYKLYSEKYKTESQFDISKSFRIFYLTDSKLVLRPTGKITSLT